MDEDVLSEFKRKTALTEYKLTSTAKLLLGLISESVPSPAIFKIGTCPFFYN